MADDRRAQLERWRQERLRERRPVQSTTVAVQRRVVHAAATKQPASTGRGLSATGGATPAARTAAARTTTIAARTTTVATRPTTVATKRTLASATAVSASTTETASALTRTSVGDESRRVSASGSASGGSRNTSLDSATSDQADQTSAEKVARKEKRRTSFILPSPSNVPSLAGGAKRVLTPTRLSPPKTSDSDGHSEQTATAATLATASAVLARTEDSDESDGGFGPSPRKKRAVAPPRRVVGASDLDQLDQQANKSLDDGGETDADARSVRTTLSFGAISGPLRVLHGDVVSDEDDAEFGARQADATASIDTKQHPDQPDSAPRDPPAGSQPRTEVETGDPSTGARAGPPQRGAVRVLSSGGGALGPPRRTSMGDGASTRKSLDEPKATLTLEQRLEQRRNWEMEDFVVTKNLGKGKFGNVYLAKEKHSNVSVALKVLYKSPLILEGGLKNLQREVEIQQRLLHPNLLRLFGYFYDDSCVYLILEFASHGELYKLLSKQRFFTEAFAAHYVAQVVEALEYLHGCHVIHRDIKPENLLMGPNNTIKLADFGWSVHAPQEFAKRRTFCGTPDYLSPEVLLSQEYDHRVDVWSVGVLAYEFLFGATPFHMDNQMEMYKRIETVDFHFPSEPAVSDNAKNFITRLLKRNPADRMTLAEAKQHEWLAQRPAI